MGHDNKINIGTLFRHWGKGGVHVRETRHFRKGHELTIQERLRLSEDATKFIYEQRIVGPKRETRQELEFEIEGVNSPDPAA